MVRRECVGASVVNAVLYTPEYDVAEIVQMFLNIASRLPFYLLYQVVDGFDRKQRRVSLNASKYGFVVSCLAKGYKTLHQRGIPVAHNLFNCPQPSGKDKFAQRLCLATASRLSKFERGRK